MAAADDERMRRWLVERRQPYTVIGIRRVACIRCGGQAQHQWQVCADRRLYRPLCLDCDVALNLLVLQWMGHPEPDLAVRAYAAAGGASGHD